MDVLYAAGEIEGPLPFSEPVLDTLRALVPCDVVTFHERSAAPNRVLVYTGEPVGPITPDVRAAQRRFKHQDPLRPMLGALRLTDVVDWRAWRRSEFYVQVHRPLGIEHMLWVYLDPPASDARLEFDRSESDFAERDLNVLDLLRPHLQQYLRAARRRPRVDETAFDLTPREREVLGCVAEGLTNSEVAHRLHLSPETVRKHLENSYEKLGVHTRTAAVAAFGRGTLTS